MRAAHIREPTRCAPASAAGRAQHGIVLVMVAISVFAIIAAAALALDVGHAMVNKTRLQNTVDAAVLSAAKTLDQSGSTDQARDAAMAVFQENAQASANDELGDFYGGGGVVRIEFSNTLYPFAPGTEPAQYARVAVDDFPLQTWLAGAVGIANKSVAATAVAGPSPPLGVGDDACSLAPVMVCGDPANPPGTHFGYNLDAVQVLKTTTVNGEWDVGTGNFQLIRLDGGQGGADVRKAMAGGYEGCTESAEAIDTEPGNTVGPVVQGLNTRFGRYLGPLNGMEKVYPPDVVITANTTVIQVGEDGHAITPPEDLSFNYSMYTARTAAGPYNYEPAPDGLGHFERRILAVPIGDCSTTVNGQGQVAMLGYGCFFLLQPAIQKGNESEIYGQFIESCQVSGVPGPEPGGGPGGAGAGPHVIQLYEDPDSTDS